MGRSGRKGAFRSIAVANFPNLFLINGPNAALAHTSALLSIENMVDLVIEVIRPILSGASELVEVKKCYEEAWNITAQAELKKTVWQTCTNYYKDQNGRNVLLYPGNVQRMYTDTRSNLWEAWSFK